MKNTKNEKILHRRALWLKSIAKKDPEIKEITDRLDELFNDEEIDRAYALFADMLSVVYPFDMITENMESSTVLEVYKHVEDIYGFDMVDIEIVAELADKFSTKHFNNLIKEGD